MTETKVTQEDVTAGEWEAVLDPPEIRPSVSYLRRLGAASSSWTVSERVFRFVFHEHSSNSGVFIHESRLIVAGGPFAALCRKGFAENETKNVALSAEDDPNTFAIIRAFLYGDIVCLADKNLDQLLHAARSAHRWQLIALFEVLCRFVVLNDMVKSEEDIMIIVSVLELHEASDELLEYFWISFVKHFRFHSFEESVVPNDDEGQLAEMEGPQNFGRPSRIRHCPHLARIWNLALSKGMIVRALKGVATTLPSILAEEFVMLVLEYLEPRIDDDTIVVSLIDLFLPHISKPEEMLERPGSPQHLSNRAVTCLLKCIVRKHEKVIDVLKELAFVVKTPNMKAKRVANVDHSLSNSR